MNGVPPGGAARGLLCRASRPAAKATGVQLCMSEFLCEGSLNFTDIVKLVEYLTCSIS